MKREREERGSRKGIGQLVIIALMLLSLIFVPNLESKETKQEVDKVESDKTVGDEEKHYNPLAMDGIEAREGRYGSATGDSSWFDYYAYTDYIFYKGSWTDGNGNPYVKVSFKIDTRYAYKEDANGVSTMIVDVPSQLSVVKNSMSMSSNGISVSYANNNRKLTFKWNNGLKWRTHHINYVCVVNTASLPAAVKNGSSKLYTIGTDASKSSYGCAYVTTPDCKSYLRSSPGIDFYVNTSSQTRIIYPDLTYKWVTNHYNVSCGGIYIYNDGKSYEDDGDMVYYVRGSVDLTETAGIDGSNIVMYYNIPDSHDFISGSIDTSSSAMSASVVGKQVKLVINGSQLENKMYYISYRIRLNFDKIPKTYFENEDYAKITITGNTYDVLNNPDQIGMYGEWGVFGDIDLEKHYSSPRVRAGLSLYPKGGTINSGNVAYYRYGHSLTFTTDVTRTGYKFGGWYSYDDDNRYTGVGPAARYSKSYYAKWNADTYKVTLDTQGGTITSGNITSYTYGKGATLPTDSQVKRDGYLFKGWYTNAAGTGSRVYRISATETGDKTFYAAWERAVYTVKLDPNGGTINSGNVTEYTFGDTVYLPTNVTKHGHDFKGWYDNPTYSGSPVTKISPTDKGDKTYYARWEASVYSVKLHPNGGNFVPGTEVTSYTYGVGAKLPNALIIRKDAHEFGGWYDNPTFSGSPVTKIPPTDTGDKEYWAKWIKFDIVTESKLTHLYGIPEDKNVFKCKGVEFKVITESTGSINSYLTYSATKSATVESEVVKGIAPGANTLINVSDEMGRSVVEDESKSDKTVYITLKVNCKQFDGDNWVSYDVYVHKATILRFVASYEEW